MGWSAGSGIAQPIIEAIRDNVPIAKARKRIYKVLLHSFESADWDTQDEAMGIDPVFDEVLKSQMEP